MELNYKDYTGSVNYSKADAVYYGKVLDIDGLLSYEGKTKQALYQDFCGVIDDYLKMCKDRGIFLQK